MAAVDVSSMKVCDITQCSICLETFKEPKTLPCIHTFCLQCLDKHCEDKEQEEVACPLCRKVFTIPPGGNKNLPNNFFILQLLQVNKSAGVTANEEGSKQHFCELCSDAEGEIPSTSYCVECDQYICEHCSMIHKKSKVSRSHQVIREADFITRLVEGMKLAVSFCDQHPTEQNRLYCNDCKMIMCPECIEDKHYGHKLDNVNKSAEKFREQMRDDVDNVTASALKKLEQIKQLETETCLFMEKIVTTESEISRTCDQLISLIQSHKAGLIKELNVIKSKKLKEVETVKDEIERQFVIRESFKRYCQEIMSKGTACDISRTAHDLHTRAQELVKTKDEPDCLKLSGVEVTFKPSLSTTDCVKNFIGKLILRETGGSEDTEKLDVTNLLEGLTVRHVIPSTGRGVFGIAVLGNEVFVVRQTSQVYVYKSDDFTSIRYLTVTGSRKLQGLVSCSHYNSMYAVDPKPRRIYRYNLTTNVITHWLVGGLCTGLSVTKCNNILATLQDTKRVQEYTTHGSLIREINLDSGIEQPRHCVQLSTGNYVMCHARTQHEVCTVDQSGCIIQSCDKPRGAGDGHLNYLYHLAVDKHDNVLVADYMNSKINLLSPTLTYLGDIVIPEHQLKYPKTLNFDELNHRLYIGEWHGGRMFVLDVKY